MSFRTRYSIVLISLLTFALSSAGQSPAKELYVSPKGKDSNPGTSESPFRTLKKARDAVRALATDVSGDIVVYLEDGTYTQAMTLRFDDRDSGRSGNWVVYRAAQGAKPVISGGRPVSGWVKDAGNRWKAPASIDDTRQLYVNGVRAKRARGEFPEGAEEYGDLQFIDGDAGYILPESAASMAEWKNQDRMELGYFNSWGHMICRVHDIAKDEAGSIKMAMHQPNYFLVKRKEGVQAQYPNYVENAIELLDEPGEWYLDRTSKTFYYIPRDGEDMAKAKAVAASLDTLVEIRGSLDKPAHHIRFESITFADATWLRPNTDGHSDVQANFVTARDGLFERDNSVVRQHNEYEKSPANIVLHAAQSVVFERCTFTRLGGAGIDVECGSRDNTINGCHFYDISGSAIQIGDVTAHDHHPDDERRIVKNNTVTNNYIHEIGAEYEDSVGVFAGYTEATTVAHNEICDLPYSGISCGWGWGEEDSGGGGYPIIVFRYNAPTPAKDNRIEFNHIHHVMLTRNDGGGIYTLGNQPGTIIQGNHIHDNEEGPGGIYLDEGSGFIEITDNVVYSVDTPMNYNNRVQDRIKTCNEHDNFFEQPDKAADVRDKAGLGAEYRDLLEQVKMAEK